MGQTTVAINGSQLNALKRVIETMEKEKAKGNVSAIIIAQREKQPSSLSISNLLADEKYIAFEIMSNGTRYRHH